MNKNLLLGLLALGSVITIPTFAQKNNVGIGTTKPDQSAVLDINSTNQGLLIPRMSLQQRNNIQNPALGLMVYQADFLSGFYFYDGKEWKSFGENASQKSVAGIDGDWVIGGNNVASIGVSAVGSTNQPLRLMSNGTTSGLLGGTTLANGNYNTTLGGNAMSFYTASLLAGSSPTASRNTAIGYFALRKNVAGSDNFALGLSAAFEQLGSYNIAIGNAALLGTAGSTGSYNTAIGYHAMQLGGAGSQNTAVGPDALENNNGTGNVAIGYQAAKTETGSNKLYISNSSSANPLIKGEFDKKNLKINTGATVSQTLGFLAVGNFDAAFAMPSPTNSYRLIVQDGIITEEIKVAVKGTADWADYVFEPSYKLMSLDKVESFVKENKHLPNVPSADEMSKNGLDLTQTSAKLMEKIEELTLYMIEMNKEIKALKSENESLKKSIK